MTADAFGVVRAEVSKAGAHLASRMQHNQRSSFGKRGIIRNARAASVSAAKVAEDAAEMTGKFKTLIPGRRAGLGLAAGGIAGLGAANGGATYVGAKRGTRAGMKPPKNRVGKAFDKRKAAGTGTQIAGGATAAYGAQAAARSGTNALGHAVRASQTREAANQAGRRLNGVQAVRQFNLSRQHAKMATLHSREAGKGGKIAGAGLLVAAGGTALKHRRSDDLAKAFALAKAGYDPEVSRHRRATVAAGAAVAGAAGAGASAVEPAKQARKAFASARDKKYRTEGATFKAGQPAPGRTLRAVQSLARDAAHYRVVGDQSRAAGRALAGKAGGRAAIAAGLTGAAIGIHRHDKKGSGRTYDYR